MTNGLEVMLPEVEPAKAVQQLASLVRDSRVLEKDIVTLDLREPHRVTVRLTENAAALREEMLKERAKAAAKDKGGLT
jgi:cell division protein FtsQ